MKTRGKQMLLNTDSKLKIIETLLGKKVHVSERKI